MDDLIMKIMDIESRAQEIIRDAREADANLEADIKKESEELHRDIERRAEAKTETIRRIEDTDAEKKISEIREKTKSDIALLEKKCTEKKEAWVNEIVENIVG